MSWRFERFFPDESYVHFVLYQFNLKQKEFKYEIVSQLKIARNVKTFLTEGATDIVFSPNRNSKLQQNVDYRLPNAAHIGVEL